MSLKHTHVRLLAAGGLVIALTLVGGLALWGLRGSGGQPKGAQAQREVRTSLVVPPDPSLVRLRQQAGEVLTGRPSRLARQMPGATAQLVAWLEAWEQRLDPSRGDPAAMGELLSLIAGSDLTTWDLTRLCRSMMVLDGRVETGVVWVEPITSAAERDLALLKDDPAGREALAEQVHRAAGQAVWHCRDGALQERLVGLLVEHLPRNAPSWQWVAANQPLVVHFQGLREGSAESAGRARVLLSDLWKQDLSGWGAHPLAELHYVSAILAFVDGEYEGALALAEHASDAPGYHHARQAALLRLRALWALGRRQEADRFFVEAARRFRLSDHDIWMWAQAVENIERG